MDLDLGLVADFLVLVKERHYGRAAGRLHLTSSALTKRIHRLERQLGVALVERSPAGCSR
ncbi:LysR family transcriptional regulator [Streptosporangium lutulentum]